MGMAFTCDRCDSLLRGSPSKPEAKPAQGQQRWASVQASDMKRPAELCEDCLESFGFWWRNGQPERTSG